MVECRRKIGLTMRIVEAQGYLEPRDAIAHDWPRFLQEALPGLDWMFLPNLGAAHIGEYCAAWGISALILTGGEDIGTAPLRDSTERSLLVWAESKHFPVLGICRGLQVMATSAGATLRQVVGHVQQRHVISENAKEREVNSYHSWGLSECPVGYTVIARAADGEIEAIRNDSANWEGWMWHPERELHFDELDIKRIRDIFK